MTSYAALRWPSSGTSGSAGNLFQRRLGLERWQLWVAMNLVGLLLSFPVYCRLEPWQEELDLIILAFGVVSYLILAWGIVGIGYLCVRFIRFVIRTINRKEDRAMSNTYHFQVNLGGMLDVLSNHLYKSPDVFLPGAAAKRCGRRHPAAEGAAGLDRREITITVEPGCRRLSGNNGAGLSEEGIHRFLAVIGQSSKTELINGKIPEDYIGRFGIGLLSCFMVSDSIVIHTRPAAGGGAHVWTGLPDGTYTLEPLEECPVGTAVILTAKPGMEHYFQPRKVAELVHYYGLALPVPVYLSGDPERLTAFPPTSPASAAASFSPLESGSLRRSFWRPSPSRRPTSAAWPMCSPTVRPPPPRAGTAST